MNPGAIVRTGAIAGLLSALAACAVRPGPLPPNCPLPSQNALQAELLFGLSMPGNSIISDADFAGFVALDIAPKFPDGLTILAGQGQYRAPGAAPVHEGARVVMIAAPDDAATTAKLAAIRRAYRERFHQRSVGLITVESCAAF